MDKAWYKRVEEKIDNIHTKVAAQRDEEIQRISRLESGHTALWWLLTAALATSCVAIAKLIGLG